MDFRDQVVLVTGGSSGIGLATARLLAAHGAHVWLLARDATRLARALTQVALESTAPEGSCGYVVADVADPQQVELAVAEVCSRAGVPDLVINSAGLTQPGYFLDLDLTVFRQNMDINYFGTLHVIKAVAPRMVARGSGHIVNIASLTGLIGVFGYTAYGASKFAVRGLSDALRAELKPHGINMSIVFPPDTDTPQLAFETPMKPFETKALASNARVLSAETVAVDILRGVARGRYMIIPGDEGKFLFRLSGLAGTTVYPIIDLLLSRARRKKGAPA